MPFFAVRALRCAVRVHELSARPRQQRFEHRRIDGFYQMAVEARQAGAVAIFVLAVAGHGDEHGTLELGAGAEAGGDLVAVHARQPDVEEQDFGVKLASGPLRLSAWSGETRIVAACPNVTNALHDGGTHNDLCAPQSNG